MTACIAEAEALRYTPAGLPALTLRLEHESRQTEAGHPREVKAAMKAIAFGAMAELEHAFKFNDAVLRHLTVQKKKAETGPSSMMKTVEREEARKASQAEFAANNER